MQVSGPNVLCFHLEFFSRGILLFGFGGSRKGDKNKVKTNVSGDLGRPRSQSNKITIWGSWWPNIYTPRSLRSSRGLHQQRVCVGSNALALADALTRARGRFPDSFGTRVFDVVGARCSMIQASRGLMTLCVAVARAKHEWLKHLFPTSRIRPRRKTSGLDPR